MKKAILFDLDGTLLNMNVDMFTKLYFGGFGKKMVEIGISPENMMNGMNAGLAAMIKNDGSLSNEELFWKIFEKESGIKQESIKDTVTEFYKNDFIVAKQACTPNIYSKKIIDHLKEKGYRCICATNPLFPAAATLQRIAWSGIKVEDFDYITTYENCHYAKPNPEYFKEILAKNNLSVDEVIMVGNDSREDGAVRKIGMDLILVTDELIDRDGNLPDTIFSGTLEESFNYFKMNY